MNRRTFRMYFPRFRKDGKGPEMVYLAYFAYSYTRDPKETTEEVKRLAQKILKKRDDIILIIPHFAFDAVWDFPEGNTHPEVTRFETEIISRSDMFIYDPKDLPRSPGAKWEKSIAETLGKPVFTVKEVMRGAKP